MADVTVYIGLLADLSAGWPQIKGNRFMQTALDHPARVDSAEPAHFEPRICSWCEAEYSPHFGTLEHVCPACAAAYQQVYHPAKGGAA